MPSSTLQQLEAKLDKLLQSHQQLTRENQQLRQREHQLLADSARLKEKNQLATKKIEAVLGRLKTLG